MHNERKVIIIFLILRCNKLNNLDKKENVNGRDHILRRKINFPPCCIILIRNCDIH